MYAVLPFLTVNYVLSVNYLQVKKIKDASQYDLQKRRRRTFFSLLLAACSKRPFCKIAKNTISRL